MRITLAETAGFCFGVDRAVTMAYELAEKGKKDIENSLEPDAKDAIINGYLSLLNKDYILRDELDLDLVSIGNGHQLEPLAAEKLTEMVNDAKKAKDAGLTVIAVTSKPESPLAEAAKTVLVIPGTVKGDTGEARGSIQLLSSLFDQSLHITLDALCLLLSRRDHTANETATKAHW